MKLIWLLRAVSFLMIIGTVGSIEINKIDSYTAFLQIALGFSLLILSNFWVREIKKARWSRRKASVLVEWIGNYSTCILTQGEINGN